jgi:hypothetical protein
MEIYKNGKGGVKRMKIAYVAGPYRAKTKIGIIRNIVAARKVAKELWKMGYAAICPHSNTALFDGICPDENFLQGDLDILQRCDIMVLVKGWEKSSGTRGEIEFAVNNNILIYEWDYFWKDINLFTKQFKNTVLRQNIPQNQ